MQLQDLKPAKGSRKRKQIIGRGRGSGRGKTSGRGDKGQMSRTGRWVVGPREGGQMRLLQRLPKVGFRNPNPTVYQIVNVGQLEKFAKGTVITAEILKENSLIASLRKPFKILAKGDLTKALTVQTKNISNAAKEKVIKAGGKVEEPVVANKSEK
jgi:large subunit ribosomal protein L15